MSWMESNSGFDFESAVASQSASTAVSNLRAVRLLESVGQMSPKAHAFERSTELFIDGDYSLKQLSSDFADTFKTFADAAKSAEKSNLITSQGREVVDGVMEQIRQEFEDSMKMVKKSLEAVENSTAYEYSKDFVHNAQNKLSKLTIFWENTLKNGQIEKPSSAVRMEN